MLELTLEACPEAEFIPAHIWTPHFSMFGAFSGFDTIEECFADMTPHIHAVETGLSSDPPMNWRVSMLDGLTLVSHSDAHSPAKLGREADLLDTGVSYPELVRAIRTGEGFCGTVEFFSGGRQIPSGRAPQLRRVPDASRGHAARRAVPRVRQKADHWRRAPRGGAGGQARGLSPEGREAV